MKGVSFKKIFWIFIIGSIFGTLWETFYHFIKFNEIVSRKALIYGPFNPVYGFGALIFIILTNNKNTVKIFFKGMILGGFCEYTCSLFQEKVFGTIAWNYSSHILNLNGRTSIPIMIFWGLLALLFVKIIYPFLSNKIDKMPKELGSYVTVSLVIFMIFNILISTSACLRQKQRIEGSKANNSIAVFLDKHYPDERLNKIYQNSKKR